MSAVTLEIISPLPTSFFHCLHGERIMNQVGVGEEARRQELERYPEDFQREMARLPDWLPALSRRHGSALHIRAIDPMSPLGLYRSERHLARGYHTSIIDGRDRMRGWNPTALEQALERRMGRSRAAA